MVSKKKSKPVAYKKMIAEAITETKDRKGASRAAIKKYIQANYDVPENFQNYIRLALRRGEEDGAFIQVSRGRFRNSKPAAKSTKKSTPKKKTKKSKKSTDSPKKRGRKPKKVVSDDEDDDEESESEDESSKKSPKKRTTRNSKKSESSMEEDSPKKKTPKKKGRKSSKSKESDSEASPKKKSPKKTTKRGSSKKATKETPAKKSPRKSKKETPAVSTTATTTTTSTTTKMDEDTDYDKSKVTTVTNESAPKKGQAKELRKPELRKSHSMSIETGPTLSSSVRNTLIEIVFSFDTTGSMYGALDEVRKNVSELVTNLMGDLPGLRIGIIAMGDYDQGTRESYVVKRFNFSRDPKEITKFVRSVEKTGGGDFEERYEVMLHEAQKFEWSENFSHNLVVIGDAIPHPKGNKYNDLDWEVELENLAKDYGVRVYSVQCNNNSQSTSFYQKLADKSGGVKLELSQFSRMKEMFLGLCYREATEYHYQKNAKQIEGLKRSESAQLLVPEEMDMKKSHDLSNDDILKIHNAIHDKSQKSVHVKAKDWDVSVGEAGCRFVRVDGLVFIEQNKEKDTKYARMALEGKLITWICHEGRWGLVVDNSVVRI